MCGDISGVAGTLIQSEAQVLDYSFKDFPANLGAYSKAALERVDKMIGFGCVSPTPDPQLLLDIKDRKRPWMDAVEFPEEIKKLILEGGEEGSGSRG